MEGFGAFLDEDWESMSRIFSIEDSDFLLHFEGTNLFDEIGSTTLSAFDCDQNNQYVAAMDHHDTIFDSTTNNRCCVPQESTSAGEIESTIFGGVNLLQDATTYYNTFDQSYVDLGTSKNDERLLTAPFSTDDVMEEILQLKAELCSEKLGSTINAGIQHAESGDSCEEILQLKRKYEDENSSESTKKKPRVSRNAQKNKRNSQSASKMNKKDIKINTNIDQDQELINNNAVKNGQSSTTSSTEEDDSNNTASQELINGKSKVTKGPATDPQSLYARKRRERINERLRLLQNLVPNGTKVDISTMLEDAVHYVKFLQVQIKLLSSDDLWMYAPIAYNGMDIGLYQKIVPNPWPQN